VEPPDGSRPLAADLLEVTAPPDERLLRFLFRKVRGRVRSVQIIIELITNQWNAVLVEDGEEWIRHILWTRQSGSRDLSVGQAYRPPERPERRGVEEALTEAEWEQVVVGSDVEQARTALLETVAFTSPLNLPALLVGESPAGGRGTVPDPEASKGPLEGYPLWLRLRSLEAVQPCVIETTRGYQPYIFDIKGFKSARYPTILDAFDAASRESDGQPSQDRGILAHLERALFQARGRVRGIEREMGEASDAEAFREKANLLLARLGELKRGVAEVTLTGFQGESVTLHLDPTLSPHENAEALYQEAARRERAQKKLPSLLKVARNRVEELTELQGRIRAGELLPEEAKALLSLEPQREKGPVRGSEIRLPYKRYRSSGGLEIRVGRGSSENDALTFRHARPEDVWLHAREASGAHVVLRWTDEDAPPSKDLSEAAILAALHSRARHAGIVPVDWTRRKHVRKPRRTPPGTVRLEKSATIFVEPDPGLPDRLAWGD
jgi:predicted ribosome quality control (RQC) complex YloA/Tae2 family protein